MPYQPTLPEPSGKELPSPLFTPRPGWGGQLKNWLGRNIYSTIFRGILLAAAVLIVLSLIRAPERLSFPEPTPTPEDTAIIQVTLPGEGISQVSYRALDEWLALQEPAVILDAVQHLYAVDRISRIVMAVSSRPSDVIYAGEVIRFPQVLIRTAVEEARALEEWQYRAWSKLVR